MNPLYRRLLLFFVLSCALSWIGNLGNLLWPSDFWMTPINPLGPIIAAPIVIAGTEGWTGLKIWLRRIAFFRAPLAVYAWAFIVPGAIIAASFGLTVLSGAQLAPLPHYGLAEILAAAPFILIAGPAPEEPAFRGYGLHNLQQNLSPLAASLWIGFGVMVWHVPLMVTGELSVAVLLPLTGVAVVYGWLYQMGRSVWPLVLLHFQLNFISAGYTGPMMPQPGDQTVYLLFLGLFYIAWALIIVYAYGPALGGKRERPDVLVQQC